MIPRYNLFDKIIEKIFKIRTCLKCKKTFHVSEFNHGMEIMRELDGTVYQCRKCAKEHRAWKESVFGNLTDEEQCS